MEATLLTLREVAQQTQVSEKTIWLRTQPRGPLKCVRIGRTVRYRQGDVDDWLTLLADEQKLGRIGRAKP